MLDDKQLEKVLELYFNRFNNVNTKTLQLLGETIKQFDGITPSEAQKLAQELKYGTDLDDLIDEISEASGKSVQDVKTLLDKVAEENVNFAETYYKAQNKEFVDYKNNERLKNYVNSVANQTNGMFRNIARSQNIGFTYTYSNGITVFKPLRQMYNDVIDEAVYNVSIGVEDYQSAMRNTMKQLADSGVKVHSEKISYLSGYNKRIDSAVRQNILDAVRATNIGIQQQIGEEIGADGVEISAHSPCAEDHLSINGRQFSKKQFEKINGSLDRPIGEYNCKHFIFSIIMGVSRPSYTKKQLRQMKKESNAIVEYKGQTYTKYEATQVQRKLETEVRRQKDRQIIARASGDMETVDKAQKRISVLTKEYNNFSETANLKTYKERMTVSGYHRIKTN